MKIRREFPDFKFSITKSHNSGIDVVITQAPFNMLVRKDDFKESRVNPYYITDHYKNYPEVMNVLLRIKEIIQSGQKEEVYDSDYGSVPNFYISISIGGHAKPFSVKRVNKKR
jgi:hypothetical protein